MSGISRKTIAKTRAMRKPCSAHGTEIPKPTKTMIHKNHLKSIFCLVLLGTGQSSIAATPLLNQNFETNVAGDKLSLPWTWSVETFANNAGAPGGYLGGFYPGTVTNPNIHAVVDGQSGAQGNNALKVYADYGFAPNFDNNQWVRTSVYQNKTLVPGDVVDGGIKFNFDYAAFTGDGGLATPTIAFVYFQLLSPDFSTTYARLEEPVTPSNTAFQSGSLSITLNGTNVGNQLQWGFATLSQNYSPSAILVDNLLVTSIPEPSGATLAALGVVLLGIRRRRI
jgi:hypothetical protein